VTAGFRESGAGGGGAAGRVSAPLIWRKGIKCGGVSCPLALGGGRRGGPGGAGAACGGFDLNLQKALWSFSLLSLED
jgi:hypothetical protein